MEYIDSEDEMNELMQAADHIKSWASDQMGSMRRPNKPSERMEEEVSPEEESMESPHMEKYEDRPEIEQPMDVPPPRDLGKPIAREKTVMEIIEPGMGMRKMPPKGEDMMDDWSNETIKKLDKFGKKMPRR